MEDSIFSEMKAAVHEALDDLAEEYIDEAVDNFEYELRKKKNETIIKILNSIEMSSEFNPKELRQDIHILFRKE